MNICKKDIDIGIWLVTSWQNEFNIFDTAEKEDVKVGVLVIQDSKNIDSLDVFILNIILPKYRL